MRRFFLWLWLAAAVAVSALVLCRTGSYRSLAHGRSAETVQRPSVQVSGAGTENVAPDADSVALGAADTLPVRHVTDSLSTEGHDFPVSPAADDAADTLRVVK